MDSTKSELYEHLTTGPLSQDERKAMREDGWELFYIGRGSIMWRRAYEVQLPHTDDYALDRAVSESARASEPILSGPRLARMGK